MTELKGLEGYITALREPEQWEVDDCLNPGQWLGVEAWERWSSATCSNPDTCWRKKALSREGTALVLIGTNALTIILPNEFAGRTVRYRIETT